MISNSILMQVQVSDAIDTVKDVNPNLYWVLVIVFVIGCVVWYARGYYDKNKNIDLRVASVEDDLTDIKNSLIEIKTYIGLKDKRAMDMFSMKKSPRKLNPIGERVYKDIKGQDFLIKNKLLLFEMIDKENPKTSLDVELAANSVCITATDRDIFNEIKDYIYNAPSLDVSQEGEEPKSYDLTLNDVCFILSIPLRDMYLAEHKELLGSNN